jgi:D-sedoheptulose 7-phosphate isomerase
MSTQPVTSSHLARLEATLRGFEPQVPRLEAWGRRAAELLWAGHRLLACGNGGSAEQAQHLTAELVGRYQDERRPFAAFPLTSDMAAVTAIGNDYGLDHMFARQVRAHGRSGDLLICLSTSGQSRNVVMAAEAAASIGMTAWALTGRGPNPLAAVCADAVMVDAAMTCTVQEVHLAAIHILCAAVDAATQEAATHDRSRHDGAAWGGGRAVLKAAL